MHKVIIVKVVSHLNQEDATLILEAMVEQPIEEQRSFRWVRDGVTGIETALDVRMVKGTVRVFVAAPLCGSKPDFDDEVERLRREGWTPWDSEDRSPNPPS